MNPNAHFEEPLICRLGEDRSKAEPCTIVIFGASGDLTERKLIPALYHLFISGQMPEDFRILGFARREKTEDSWREELRGALAEHSRTGAPEPVRWAEFARHIGYCRGDIADGAAYGELARRIEGADSEALRQNLLFYLATNPSQFGLAVRHLHAAGLLQRAENGTRSRQRVVVEKPFGHDLASAQALNHELTRHLAEQQIFRIDHYLGKETVQNILIFRFSNAIFERLWTRDTVDHVQITVSEAAGVGDRGGYYEESGALRDMVQNHLFQVLALMTMEPPVSLDAEAIRDEKVKLLRAVRAPSPGDHPANVVRGQYFAGKVKGEPCAGYRQEPRVKPDSNVETYVALRVFIDNWRWSGVPFYLRTGKRLPKTASEVRIQFRPTPYVLFAARCGERLDANSLTLHLQPNEGISLRYNGKVPGANVEVRPVRMHFDYDSEFGAYTPEAYERLLLEAMAGDATLFIRRDEVETAWKIVDSIRETWAARPLCNSEFYSAGTWGPAAADELVARAGHHWRAPVNGAPKA